MHTFSLGQKYKSLKAALVSENFALCILELFFLLEVEVDGK